MDREMKITDMNMAERLNSLLLHRDKLKKMFSDYSVEGKQALDEWIKYKETATQEDLHSLIYYANMPVSFATELAEVVKMNIERAGELDLKKFYKNNNFISSYEIKITDEEKARELFDQKCVNLGKLLNLFESVVLRICNNNIDKYVLKDGKSIASAKAAMIWLYVDSMDARELDFLDIERFFNMVRLQILKDFQTEEKIIDDNFVNIIHGRIRENLYQNDHSTEKLRTCLGNFKENTRDTITTAFDVYSELNIFWQYLQVTDNYSDNYSVVIKDSEGTDHILYLAQTIKQILTQQLTAYTKLNGLEIPHSELESSCFKHSDLSDSNLVNSILCNSQLNNSVWKNCNLSICNLKQCSAINCDFSGSNFNYSNLSGVNLNNAILNDAQLTSVALRDPMIETYADYISDMINNAYKSNVAEHIHEISATLENVEYAKKMRKILEEAGGRESEDYKIIFRGKEIRTDFIEELAKCAQSDKANLALLWQQSPVVYLGDETAHILLANKKGEYKLNDEENSVAGTVLDAVFTILLDKMKSFIEYHKQRVIAPDMLNSLREFERDENREDKIAREAKYGKICFQTVSLKEVSAKSMLIPKTDMSYVDATDISLESSDVSEAIVHHAIMIKSYWGGANLNKSDFYDTDLGNSNLNHAKIMDAVILDSNLTSCDFSSATLIKTFIISTDRDKPYLNDLLKPYDNDVSSLFDEVEDKPIKRANDKDWTMRDSNWANAKANEIALIGLDMDRSHFEQANLKSALLFNCLSRWSFFDSTDLSYAILMGVSFHQSSMQSVIMSKAWIFACEFSGCRLSLANLIGSSLRKIIFFNVDMSGVNISHADIHCCSFRNVNWNKINITNTNFEFTVFNNVDFSMCIGLEDAIFTDCIFTDCGGVSENKNIKMTITAFGKEIPLLRNTKKESKDYKYFSTKHIKSIRVEERE